MTRKWTLLIAYALLVAPSALSVRAGEAGKCSYSTQECLNAMASRMKTSGWIGVELEIDANKGVYRVSRVVPGSPAEGAGIVPGDLLFALEGIRLCEENHEKLAQVRKDWKPGQTVNYTIQRDGADRKVTLTLAPMPADVVARQIGQHMLMHAAEEVASTK